MTASQSGAVIFDYALWQTSYPELASVTAQSAGFCFAQAQFYLNNTASSKVRDFCYAGDRNLMLNMLTAHIAKLTQAIDGQPAQSLVGRISNASEGSVSVAVEMPASPNAAWFMQTQYGAAFWQATLAYRSGGRYFPGRLQRFRAW